MTPDAAVQWISYATKQPVDRVLALGLTADQIVMLGGALASNPLINPPVKKPLKQGEFVCACGCGETFEAEYRTSKPKYKNAAHKARAYRARRRERELAALEAARPRAVGLIPKRSGGFQVVHETA